MARSRPVLVTAVLSAAAVLGYVTYRATSGRRGSDPDAPEEHAAAAPPALHAARTSPSATSPASRSRS